MTVWFPSETIRYRGVAGVHRPDRLVVKNNRKVCRIGNAADGHFSDPFKGEVTVAVVVIVLFNPGSDGVENGTKAAEVVVFSLFLFVIVAQPAARIHPTTITRAQSAQFVS